jgi:inositol phosphorylceramide mannosyltransferase catalytic subunit
VTQKLGALEIRDVLTARTGVNNDLMAARRNHPLLGKMTKSLERRNKNLLFPYLTIFWATGPQFTSDVLKEYWLEQRIGYRAGENKSAASECSAIGYRRMMIADEASDPDDFFVLPLPFYSEEYTFFGHSPGGTWHEGDVALVLWFVDRPWVLGIIALCLVLPSGFYAFRRMKRTPWFRSQAGRGEDDEIAYAMIDVEHERWQGSD